MIGFYFYFVCSLDEASCTGCYWWLGGAGSCIQVFSFVWVLTIWFSLGLVLWYSKVLESVLPLWRPGLDLNKRLRAFCQKYLNFARSLYSVLQWVLSHPKAVFRQPEDTPLSLLIFSEAAGTAEALKTSQLPSSGPPGKRTWSGMPATACREPDLPGR